MIRKYIYITYIWLEIKIVGNYLKLLLIRKNKENFSDLELKLSRILRRENEQWNSRKNDIRKDWDKKTDFTKNNGSQTKEMTNKKKSSLKDELHHCGTMATTYT